MKRKNDYIVIGLALFAMFFGAGNLLFPPALGLMAGTNWFMTNLGFVVTGVGFPILGVIALCKCGGTIDGMASKIHPLFSKALGIIVVLAIGPLLAIPRTGATVFEVGVKPLFPEVHPMLSAAIYFSITLFFVIKPSGIMDKIGKILTPILVFMMGVIIIKGILNPIGIASTSTIISPFGSGFREGYQTMDALGSILMGGLVIVALKEKGYNSPAEKMIMTAKAGLIAGAGLAFVYTGLMYIGATASNVFAADLTKSELIMAITSSILGGYGKIGMSLVVSAACLTTSIGLTAVVGNYFNELSAGKLSYKAIVIATCVFSALASVLGVELIVKLAIPLLVLVYPVVIILIILNLFSDILNNRNTFRGAVIGALLVSSFDALAVLGVKMEFISNLIMKLPFASSGFSWLLPSIILSVLMTIFIKDDQANRVYSENFELT